ncbi:MULTISPECIES: hypothetical protein [Bacillus]|uniref:hypothetical protein n=1 Tax=Bacillus TaxID=1386 RepID=UPI000EFC64B7|nr:MULTISPECIES: hypothetical protein [Bacillus]HBO5951905.1 hypothetical protein [Pseudomonas aeruginosa]MCV4329351.1 hypothetical protein [Bacillus velezensis]MDH3075832.1 hypothetical protein [Bacillus velezensis]MDH3104098.1 hypothetical protein [Bacillus velezensis]MDH3138998.1 hypothetical protein [Bacillus velezensis]
MGKILIADLFIKENKKHLCALGTPEDINVVFDKAYQLRKEHKCAIDVRIVRLSGVTTDKVSISIEEDSFNYDFHNELDI